MKGDEYSDAELVKIYRKYARRKGWNSSEEVAYSRVRGEWRASMVGPVGLAIDWYESGGKDPKPELGKDATTRLGFSKVVHLIIVFFAILIIGILAAILLSVFLST